MKFLPPGRSLWAMGTSVTEERGLFAALNNCAFVSTKNIDQDPSSPFCFTMDSSMLGVGVGFDTLGENKVVVIRPSESDSDSDSDQGIEEHVIPDSREGWVASVGALLKSYLLNDGVTCNRAIRFDYSRIRPAGLPIKGFGGTSSGPEPLQELHDSIRSCLDPLHGKPITVTAIVDLMNLIGKCVVAGNVRRTAEIAFGDPDSEEYINLKDYSINPHRAEYGWTSNNSVFAKLGMDYSKVVEKIRKNGEPGLAWLQNMREYGRMVEPKNYKDMRAMGGNPCLEQTLEPFELCCLVETFPNNHESFEDFQKTLELAFLYAKIVTLGHTHWPESNRVMLRNRRIGCSMSGIAQFVAKSSLDELREWSERGYKVIQDSDVKYSEWFAVPTSIKTTCIKPSGTVSLLAGATPGVHYPESRYYVRRVRLSSTSELIPALKRAGYHIEPSATDPAATSVVSVPIDVGEGIRTAKDVTMWEQLSLAAFLQRYWADNQVSCTVTFDPQSEATLLEAALDFFQYQLKGVSFLPRLATGAYPQMPYEEIDEQVYAEMSKSLRSLKLEGLGKHSKLRSTTAPVSVMRTDTVAFETTADPDIGSGDQQSFDRLSVDDGVSLSAGSDLMPDSFCDAVECSIPITGSIAQESSS